MNTKNCPSCGAPIALDATECKYCGEKVALQQQYAPPQPPPQQPQYAPPPPPQYVPPQQPYAQPQYQVPQPPPYQQVPIYSKSKTTAGILAILLGGIGAHKFYLGSVGLGILYLIFSWTFIPSLVGFIEGIIYLCAKDEEFYYKYVRK
jgi:TM2 domain-containing membrane protein YozV